MKWKKYWKTHNQKNLLVIIVFQLFLYKSAAFAKAC